MTTDTIAEHQPFQAEVAELLNLMVHSVYSETDIFLRELISNGSDALDKLRYEAIAAPELTADGEPPQIRIVPDKGAGTLSVIDNGRRLEVSNCRTTMVAVMPPWSTPCELRNSGERGK